MKHQRLNISTGVVKSAIKKKWGPSLRWRWAIISCLEALFFGKNNILRSKNVFQNARNHMSPSVSCPSNATGFWSFGVKQNPRDPGTPLEGRYLDPPKPTWKHRTWGGNWICREKSCFFSWSDMVAQLMLKKTARGWIFDFSTGKTMIENPCLDVPGING